MQTRVELRVYFTLLFLSSPVRKFSRIQDRQNRGNLKAAYMGKRGRMPDS